MSKGDEWPDGATEFRSLSRRVEVMSEMGKLHGVWAPLVILRRCDRLRTEILYQYVVELFGDNRE